MNILFAASVDLKIKPMSDFSVMWFTKFNVIYIRQTSTKLTFQISDIIYYWQIYVCTSGALNQDWS